MSTTASTQLSAFPDAPERILSPAECEELARLVASRPDLWQDVELAPTESGTRSYALLRESAEVEIWLLAWRPGHSTGFHDHGVSNVGFCVAEGSLVEQRLRFAEAPSELLLGRGDARSAGSDYIHCLDWRDGDPALSVHVYSPPLAVVGQYRVEGDGSLARRTQPGRDELTRD